MDAADRRIRLKTRLFAVIVVLSGAFGNFFLDWGLRKSNTQLSMSPVDYVVAIFDPWVTLGVALLIVWLLARMALLSWADLSYVLPVTAIGYVATALMGRFFLHEQVTPQRWAGTLLIVLGIGFVARTNPRTTPEREIALAGDRPC
ncbi:MAG: EamA family transporter [Acidobacteria bacterium]|nr:EamA family transporter [Acidobacteriota bacterium]